MRITSLTFDSVARAPSGATLHSGSRFERALAGLRAGDRIFVGGPVGTLLAVGADEPQVLVAQGIGITPFLAMARSQEHLDATLLQVGTPHYFEQTAVAMAAAEHHDHRDGLTEAVARAVLARPDARWSLSGRTDFVSSVASQLRQAGVPGRRIHKDAFWTLRAPATTAPATTAPVADRAGRVVA